jgi:hypothetical protein
MEDFEAGERPRIINKPSHGLKHQIPVTKVPITLSTNTAHQLNNHLFLMIITILKTNLGSSRNPLNPASIRQISRIQSPTSTVQCKNNSAAIIDDRSPTRNLFQQYDQDISGSF